MSVCLLYFNACVPYMCPPPYPYTSCVHLPLPIHHVSTSLPLYFMCPPPSAYISCVHLPPPIHHVSTSLPLYIMCSPPSAYTSYVHLSTPIRHVSTSLPLYVMCPPPSLYTSYVHLPPLNIMYPLYSHVHKAGGLCIVDEIQTGFGRGGEYFWIFQSQGTCIYIYM